MRSKRPDELEKYYCMQCKASVWMREVLDKTDSMRDAWKCIICGAVHRHPNLWKRPPKTIAEGK